MIIFKSKRIKRLEEEIRELEKLLEQAKIVGHTWTFGFERNTNLYLITTPINVIEKVEKAVGEMHQEYAKAEKMKFTALLRYLGIEMAMANYPPSTEIKVFKINKRSTSNDNTNRKQAPKKGNTRK